MTQSQGHNLHYVMSLGAGSTWKIQDSAVWALSTKRETDSYLENLGFFTLAKEETVVQFGSTVGREKQRDASVLLRAQ